MKRIILPILFIFFTSNNLFSQEIKLKKAEVKGSTLLNNEKTEKIINIPVILDSKDLKEKLEELLILYINEGYLDISVDAFIDTFKESIILNIREYENYDFRIIPDYGNIKDNFRTGFSNTAGMETGIKEILSRLNDNGYPFACLVIDSIQVKEQKINFYLKLDKGEEVKLDTIIIRGAESTNRNLILKEARLKKGMPFCYSRFDKAEKFLNNSGFLEVNGIQRLVKLPNGRYGSILDLKEKKGNRFNGIIGYMPARTADEKGYFIGEFNLFLSNISGTGRDFGIRWNKPQKNNQEVNLSYKEPWVLGLPFNLSLHFNQAFYDSLYTKRNIGFTLNAGIGDKITGNVSLGTENVIPHETNTGLIKYSGLTLSADLTYSNMDYPLNPASGILYGNSIEYVQRKNENNSDNILDKRMSLNFEFAGTVFRKNVIYLKIYGSRISASEGVIPLSRMFLLGGASDLRGYREEQFRTPYMAYSNLEYRLIPERNSRFYLFYDQAYFKLENKFTYKSGYGFGFRLQSKVGIIGFDFALAPEQSFNESKIHFRLINNF